MRYKHKDTGEVWTFVRRQRGWCEVDVETIVLSRAGRETTVMESLFNKRWVKLDEDRTTV